MNDQLTLFDRDSDYLESSVKGFDSKTASFRVHASLIYKLGESLIADEVTALSELIKNAYDADATICSLAISSDHIEEINGRECKGSIELSDNGCGMDLATIVNGWLTLSNSPKKKMKKEQKTTPKYHRYPLGDKGLGRLSVQKLGRYMQMTTKAADSNIEYCVIIPWGDFLKNTTIDQIPVTIEKQNVASDKSYTKIVIKDLIDPEMWGQSEQISLLTNSINKIVSPFRSKKSSFHVVAQINNQPIDTANTVFDELLSSARAKHTVKYSSGTASIVSEFKNSFFYNRDVLSRVMSGEFTLSESAIRDFLQTYKKDFPNVSTCFKEGVSLIAEDVCSFPDIAIPVSSSGIASNDVKRPFFNDPGDFECEIYEYSLDREYLDYLYNNISYNRLIERDEYRDFVSRYHGIKVVRDGFVIQGFGDGDGGDWLGLSSSSKTTGYFFDLRNDSVIGCVYLTGIANSVLKETTNREGFVEDEFFRAFKSIAKSLAQGFKRKACYELFQLFSDCLSDGLTDAATKIQSVRQKTLNSLFTNKVQKNGESYTDFAGRFVQIFHYDGYNKAIAQKYNEIASKAKYYESLCSVVSDNPGNNKELTDILKEYREIELYNRHINAQHCEVATGDIFEIDGLVYLLVSQSCDTYLRQNGERKLKKATLLEISDDGKKREYSYPLSCFSTMKKPTVVYHSLKILPFEILDLCAFNTSGQAMVSIKDIKEFEKELELYTINYRLRFCKVLEQLTEIHTNRIILQKFWDDTSSVSQEDAHKAYSVLEGIDADLKKYDTIDTIISFPVKRICRLNELTTIDIIKEYGVVLSRIGQPFDFTDDSK